MKIIKLIKSVAFVTIASLMSIVIAQAESPSYTVDSSNYMQHADKLTDGQMKAFESYADYRIDVYPTSAECRLPDAVRAVSGSNSKMVNGNEGIEWNTLGVNLSQILLKHNITFGTTDRLHITMRVFIEH